MKRMIYAGIGSRNTPDFALKTMEKIAERLAVLGYTFRSGGAQGADMAFEIGCVKASGLEEIYLPWRGFNGNNSAFHQVGKDALDMAALFHPAWNNCGDAAKKLHARNCYQVLGKDLKTPADFVICWTPDGCEHHDARTSLTGGTGQAISVASANNVPVINLFNTGAMDRLAAIVKVGSV